MMEPLCEVCTLTTDQPAVEGQCSKTFSDGLRCLLETGHDSAHTVCSPEHGRTHGSPEWVIRHIAAIAALT